MDFLLNVPVVEALAARLEADLPAALAARQAAVDADLAAVLAAPAVVFDYPVSIGELAVFPALSITDRPTTFGPDGGGVLIARHRALIVVHLQNADQRLLAWGLRYYLGAIAEVAIADRQLPMVGGGPVAAAYGTGIDSVVPGEALEATDPEGVDTWQTFGGVLVWAERDELA